MSHTSIIKQLCGIFDNNIDITIPKSMHLLPLEKYHEINHFVLHGVLTYKPKVCMHCGVKNTGNQDIIKHGFKPAIIRLPNTATNPVLLKLQKQKPIQIARSFFSWMNLTGQSPWCKGN